MTQEYIEKKAYEVYPKQSSISEGHGVIPADYESHLLGDANEDKREGYIKGFIDAQNEISLNSFYDGRKVAEQEYESLPKIRGWVARDSVANYFVGTGLFFHPSKPSRCGEEWSSQTIAMRLPWEMFPNLRWEDEPIKVELLIRKV